MTELLRSEAAKADSVRALARAADMSHSALQRFISGERLLRLDAADRLAEALGFELRRRRQRNQ